MGQGAGCKGLRELGKDYLESLAVYSYSPFTIASYNAGIQDLAEHLERLHVEPQQVTYMIAENWLRSLSKRQFNAASMRSYLTSVRGFWRWLMGQEVARNNPFKELKSIKYHRPVPKPLAPGQIRALIDGEVDPMWHAIWEFFYGTGLRITATRGATRSAINWEAKTITLKSKGGKERQKVLTDHLVAVLKSYLASTPDKGGPYLFQGKGGCRLRKLTISKHLTAAAKRVGIEQRVHPHLLRHSIATHLLDNGADIRHVQEFLDHASITSTQIYTQVSQLKLRSVIEDCHPRP